ncbi:phosphotransferase [Paenibacillus sp. MMS18-CY102]|uniref:phosphotransferase n=1 Tax=Paenibacillus sp. MMS18-CY102 TaxID=2682849 RepID=UPI001365FF16|nr:phosphotransferase [Paenibacillus sp. MMS18-CY102]MWC29655.1 phosphotransferase [Paenibacillus sp. MMS18-CY102]
MHTDNPIALRSVLNPQYLVSELSGQYGLGNWEQCLFWLRGLNDTYRVRTSNGLFILRIYRHGISENDVAYELSLLEQLKADLRSSLVTNVAEPICKTDGSGYTVLEAPEGRRMAVLFRHIDGTENGLTDEASCYAFGQSAAELHAAMDGLVLQRPRHELDAGFLINQPLERIVGYIGEQHEHTPFLRSYAASLLDRLAAVSKQGLDWGICHGDMHGNNNAFQEGAHFTHYDFEWSAKGWRAYDLAQVKARKRQPEHNRELLWQALLAGYRTIRALPEQDEAAIGLFISIRRLWVMSLDVAFIPTDLGALDYGQEWLEGFIAEFRERSM